MTRQDPPDSGSLRIAVLAGGPSSERAISLQSGAAVFRALRNRGHRVTLIDPLETDLARISPADYDVAFLALHGEYGEDGSVQAFLEEIGLPYTGSDAATSRLALSKSASKERFLQEDVPTPPYVLFHKSDRPARIQRDAEQLGYPLAVKPDARGSSLGVSLIEEPDELPAALEHCFRYDEFGLLERAIAGTEWTVGLLDDFVLPALQIESSRSFFDYRAKYEDDETVYRFEFDLPPETIEAVTEAGRRAAESLGTRGVVRVDLRLDDARRPWVLEVNTIPGLTDHSLIPKAAAQRGIPFEELCDRSVRSALARHPQMPHFHVRDNAAAKEETAKAPSTPRSN